MEQRRKHFAAKSAKEKEELNHNPKLIQRKIICTYLKNMEGKKPKNLKNESFDSIQKMFDRAFKRVNTFVDFRTDLVEGSSKRAGEELESKSHTRGSTCFDLNSITGEQDGTSKVTGSNSCLTKITAYKALVLPKQRRKHFAAKSAKEKRNKPPTQAQQRKIMCTYLKNMEGKKPKDLKNKSFDSIQKMFDRAFKRVNTFVDFRTDLVEGSSKRAGEELEQESTKKQKVDEDKDTAELQSLMEVIPDEEEVAIDVVPLATKPPTIVD
ncbi:hypothetical protein Tco_0168618 [Tanacetum coccineum]